jgi:hypothetical protein
MILNEHDDDADRRRCRGRSRLGRIITGSVRLGGGLATQAPKGRLGLEQAHTGGRKFKTSQNSMPNHHSISLMCVCVYVPACTERRRQRKRMPPPPQPRRRRKATG